MEKVKIIVNKICFWKEKYASPNVEDRYTQASQLAKSHMHDVAYEFACASVRTRRQLARNKRGFKLIFPKGTF